MKTVVQLVGLALGFFVIGVVCGLNVEAGNKFQAGQLSACSKIVQMDPILAIAQVTCVPHDSDVALKVGDKLYSLDGKQLN
jgi:hypothetical protein